MIKVIYNPGAKELVRSVFERDVADEELPRQQARWMIPRLRSVSGSGWNCVSKCSTST
jgi:hypothetical protein